MGDLRDKVTRMDEFSKEIEAEILDIVNYGGTMGTFNLTSELLTIMVERVNRGDKIKFWSSGKNFTNDSLYTYIAKEYPYYIVKKVYSNTKLPKVYFNIENSAHGLDLVYTGGTPNKLFKWIADIDEEYSLMELLPTHVVYIRYSKTRQIIPYLSEHNNCYVYDEKDGKIKEVNI